MTAPARVRIAVAGAGLIGRRHLEELDASSVADVAAVVDPGPAGRQMAEKYSVPLYSSLSQLFSSDRPDGVVLATPNRLHVDGGLECVAAGVPVLVEKPIGDSVDAARELVEAGEAAGVAVLTGHHRNYSPILTEARRVIDSGTLGRIVAVVGTALFYKPDDYFDENGGWRKLPGGGPILLNLIHEVNALLSLAGDITTVTAVTSDRARGFAVEDTAAMLFTFSSGALGTFALSDTAASPRSWEQTSGENASYDSFNDEDCYHIAGTQGSLSIPTMRTKVYRGKRSWWEPLESSVGTRQHSDPLARQISHFAAVIRGQATPICSGRDGLNALEVIDAVLRSAATGQSVSVGSSVGS